ncbi:MAG: hypothetical protein HQL87_14100 [Magnetococcales bacterium]|nr:hypothetical protein [Magnetococcales bacterium]
MNTPFSRAYRVDVLSLGDTVGLLSGNVPPAMMDTASFPVGSVCFQTDGTVWKRISMDADGWAAMSVAVKSEGEMQTPSLTSLNFTGGGVSVAYADGEVSVNIPGGGMPFFLFILADATVVFIPWVAPGKISLTLSDGSTGTLMVED